MHNKIFVSNSPAHENLERASRQSVAESSEIDMSVTEAASSGNPGRGPAGDKTRTEKEEEEEKSKDDGKSKMMQRGESMNGWEKSVDARNKEALGPDEAMLSSEVGGKRWAAKGGRKGRGKKKSGGRGRRRGAEQPKGLFQRAPELCAAVQCCGARCNWALGAGWPPVGSGQSSERVALQAAVTGYIGRWRPMQLLGHMRRIVLVWLRTCAVFPSGRICLASYRRLGRFCSKLHGGETWRQVAGCTSGVPRRSIACSCSVECASIADASTQSNHAVPTQYLRSTSLFSAERSRANG